MLSQTSTMGKLTCRRTQLVWSHLKNSREAGMLKDILVLELLVLCQSSDIERQTDKGRKANLLEDKHPKCRVDACPNAKEMWEVIKRLTQGENINKEDVKTNLFWPFEEELIDNAFARFNTIITSLKALNEGFPSKNYVRKFLRVLHPKWHAKVTAIEESKDLTPPSLDVLIENMKVYEKLQSKSFVGGSWSDSDDDEEEKTKDDKCLMAKTSNEGPNGSGGCEDDEPGGDEVDEEDEEDGDS
nr:UBN2 domain-containing protein [Tanacetum cinerariifolium]